MFLIRCKGMLYQPMIQVGTKRKDSYKEVSNGQTARLSGLCFTLFNHKTFVTYTPLANFVKQFKEE